MANQTKPFGLRPVRHLNGSPWNGATELCYISGSYATALFVGDPVQLDTTLTDKDDTAMRTTIIKAGEGDGSLVYGVITGFMPLQTDLAKNYNPASTERYAYVCTSPDVIYHIRDCGTTALTDVAPGQNAVFETATSGSTVTGLSGVALDTTDDPPEANASNPLRILRLANLPNNELAAYAIWEVIISLHQLRAESATNGILGVTSA